MTSDAASSRTDVTTPVFWSSLLGILAGSILGGLTYLGLIGDDASTRAAANVARPVVVLFCCLLCIRYYASIVFVSYDDLASPYASRLSRRAKVTIFVAQAVQILGCTLNIAPGIRRGGCDSGNPLPRGGCLRLLVALGGTPEGRKGPGVSATIPPVGGRPYSPISGGLLHLGAGYLGVRRNGGRHVPGRDSPDLRGGVRHNVSGFGREVRACDYNLTDSITERLGLSPEEMAAR